MKDYLKHSGLCVSSRFFILKLVLLLISRMLGLLFQLLCISRWFSFGIFIVIIFSREVIIGTTSRLTFNAHWMLIFLALASKGAHFIATTVLVPKALSGSKCRLCVNYHNLNIKTV